MTSPLANLFLSLQNTIAALADIDGNTYFKFVDQELGQLETRNAMGKPPVLFPCVLIDIDDMQYSIYSGNTQQGKGRICIRLGFPPFSASSAATPETYKEKAIYFYELEQILHLALQGNPPILLDTSETDVLADIFGNFNRISAKTELREDTLRVRQIVYEIAYDDYSTKPTQSALPTALDLNIEFEFPA